MTYQPRRLHLGCGSRYLKGFLHIDIDAAEHLDHVSSLDNLEFIQDGSVSEIYCAHSLEYFDKYETIKVLNEWKRVLVPGGKIYLTVPNFQSLIAIYEMTGDIDRILGPLFGRWQIENGFIYHRTCWDYKSLSTLLSSLGFYNIGIFEPEDYLSQFDEDYDDYSLAYVPHKDKTGIQVSLAIVATANK